MARMTGRELMVDVNAKVFKWLRESAGYSIEEITDIINPNINLKELEERNKDIKLPLSTLKRLAKLYKRQVGCFFFPTVPEDEKEIKLTYYRMAGPELMQVELKLGTKETKKINLAYRRARYYQSVIEDISEEGEGKGEGKGGKKI